MHVARSLHFHLLEIPRTPLKMYNGTHCAVELAPGGQPHSGIDIAYYRGDARGTYAKPI